MPNRAAADTRTVEPDGSRVVFLHKRFDKTVLDPTVYLHFMQCI